MFHLTKQEQLVLLILGAALLFGTTLQYALKKYPDLNDIVNLIDSGRINDKVDINSATIEELVAISYIGQYTAGNIIRYREENGPFESLEELRLIKGIRDKNYKRFSPYLEVSRP